MDSPSFKHKIRRSCCCFSPSLSDDDEPRLIDRSGTSSSSSSSWTQDFPPQFKQKCRNLICRIKSVKRSRPGSADYRYDPMSYALNFDDGSGEFDDGLIARDFNSRLPASPPRVVVAEAKAVVTSEVSVVG